MPPVFKQWAFVVLDSSRVSSVFVGERAEAEQFVRSLQMSAPPGVNFYLERVPLITPEGR